MKNTVTFLGTIVLTAVIGFSLASCGGGSSPAGNGGLPPPGTAPGAGPPAAPPPIPGLPGNVTAPAARSAHLGLTPAFSNNQLFVMDWEQNPPAFTAYTGNHPNLTFYGGVTGSITNGLFSFTLGEPSHTTPVQEHWVFRNYVNLSATPAVNIAVASFSVAGNSIFRLRYIGGTDHEIYYIWVSDDTAITGTGFNDPWNGFTVTYLDIGLVLRQGWNTLHIVARYTDTTATISRFVNYPAGIPWIIQGGGPAEAGPGAPEAGGGSAGGALNVNNLPSDREDLQIVVHNRSTVPATPSEWASVLGSPNLAAARLTGTGDTSPFVLNAAGPGVIMHPERFTDSGNFLVVIGVGESGTMLERFALVNFTNGVGTVDWGVMTLL